MKESDLNNNELLPIQAKRDISASLWAELLFTFLPFLVVSLVLFYKGGKDIGIGIFTQPEWSLASAILAGQTIVKFITGLFPHGKHINLGIVSLIITTIIVFVLSPSLIVLSLISIDDAPALWLIIVQFFLFLVSVCLFLFLGKVSQKIYTSQITS